MRVDNKEPLSGNHLYDTHEANWSYTQGITSADFYNECQSGLMKSLSSINNAMFYNDELIAITASPSAQFYKIDDRTESTKKSEGLNLEWLMRAHDANSMYMTFAKHMIRFNGGINELPMMNDIRMINVRIELLGRFSDDKSWQEYSDFIRDRGWSTICTNSGLDFGLVNIRAILCNYGIVSGCIYVDTVFPDAAKNKGIDAPSYCWEDNKQVTPIYFNGETAKTMNILGAELPENNES